MSDGLGVESEGVAGLRLPQLHGRTVHLRQITPNDYALIRAAELGGDLAVRWRFRGTTPDPEQWLRVLWQGVLTQYLVVPNHDSKPLGLVAAYGANFQDGHAHFAVEAFGASGRTPALMLGAALFVDYVFTCWPFHKLYAEVAEYNAAQFGSGIGRILQLEARLRDHLWYDGRRRDELILAIYREAWDERSPRILAAARRPARRAGIVSVTGQGRDPVDA
jgi:hypothetical protein